MFIIKCRYICNFGCNSSIFIMANSLKIASNRTVNAIEKSAFGVYLIHDSAGLRTFILDDLFREAEVQYSSALFLLAYLKK